jgi:hypothetical protein
VKRAERRAARRTALLLVEGDTEEEFFGQLGAIFFRTASKQLKNLKGNFNLDGKVADAAVTFAQRHPTELFDVYVCVDKEKPTARSFSAAKVEPVLRRLPNFGIVMPIIAILMTESLFFADIDGIYRFLRTPKSRRTPKKFLNFRRFRHQDLSQVFKQSSKIYIKGVRCKGFIAALDLKKIAQRAPELQRLIASVTKRSL